MTRWSCLPFAATVALLPAASCDPFNTGFDDTEEAVLYRASHPGPEDPPTGAIRVMTYNVKYGGARLRFFWECDGSRYLMTEAEVKRNVDALAARILAEAPDIVLLQEVDTWRSKRVAYVDQVQRILDRVGLNYGAYASQWKADYVPTDGLGPVDSGNAILSKWPITAAVRHALALQTDISSLERYFYLKRNLLEARIAVPGVMGDVAVVNLHAEAFSQDGTKAKHVAAFEALVDGLDAAGLPVLGGGDFNALPPGSDLRSSFPEDDGCTGGRFEPDQYVGEEAILRPLFDAYASDSPPDACTWAVPVRDLSRCTYVGRETFPLDRKLDHLFTNRAFAPATAAQTVLQDAMLLSDHVPVVADWVLP